jgi:outer membrane protein
MSFDHHVRSWRQACLALTAVAAAALGLQAGAAHAQDAQEAAPLVDAWRFTVGGGIASGPRYPGSSETRTRLVPVLGASYGRWFIGGVPGAGIPAGVGVVLVQDAHWRLGLAVGGNFVKSRQQSDSAALQGLGDIRSTALGTVFASWREGWFEARGNIRTDIGGKGQGTRAGLDLDARFSPGEGWMLSAGPGLTWADSKYTQTFFGINTAQGLASGRATYTPGSGVEMVRFGVGANYRLRPQWSLGLRLTAARLRGGAADSPITQKKSQDSVAVFTAYRF